ncbi:hypothetical protein [Sediminibacillus massiliensis]|uniref:hypothetical protein n=1 Tax=Sediminibacillus massiliensis TaxID=1926277 RepID=UPI000BAE20E2|nr:hypothetical protein [Sediminibacillus massiliensis]
MIFPPDKHTSIIQFEELQKKQPEDQAACYPGTKTSIVPGDVLYSSKGLSTFLVGHAGILGPDLMVYHSHPKGGFRDTLPIYLSRHKYGSDITVFRPVSGADQAAAWAAGNVDKIRRYLFHPRLDNISYNYCSKFIWQAFWYTGMGDLTAKGMTDEVVRWIYPYQIKKSNLLELHAKIRLNPLKKTM